MVVDVVLKNNSLQFIDKDFNLLKEIKDDGSQEFKKTISFFNKRRKLKAIISDDYSEYKIIRFADLHRHTDFSLLDGAVSVKDMVNKTEACGAITDHGTMSGCLEFYDKMKAQGKLPLIGEEFYCEDSEGNKVMNHLVLIAKNNQGYKNLCKLSSKSHDNFYKKPQISYDDLKKYHEGIICTSACIAGELSRNIIKYNNDKTIENAKKIINTVMFFKDLFGDDYYFEVQRHGIKYEDLVNDTIFKLGKKYNIKVVGTTDSHYLNKEDKVSQDILLCINTKKTFADENRFSFDGDGYHVHTADEMEILFADHLEVLDNTLEIAEKCQDFYIETGKYYLPDFPIPAPFKDEMSYLRELVKNGFIERYKPMFEIKKSDSKQDALEKKKKKVEYWERAKYELSVIEQMGFPGYFLIVYDFLNFCLQNDIPIGPGRGSGAGSIVLYCLHVTDIDPMEYGLLFERFLNPDRISMPDIDSDISQLQRDKVLEYVRNKYSTADITRVVQIITFGTLAAKKSMDYVLKIVGLIIPSERRIITKMIPSDPKMTLEKAYKESPEFAKWVDESEENKKMFNLAKSIEGTKMNKSVHACGVVISKNDITDYLPTTFAAELDDDGLPTGEKVLTTQYVGSECEEVGTLKMDFLGLRTLDVIDSTLKQIKRNNPKFNITSYDIPLDDPKVYEFLREGHTEGVFQFESPGMKKLLKDMYFDASDENAKEKGHEFFERLIAAASLYRPGPMDEIPHYISSLKGGQIYYDHPMLESILKNTYGILVYQEQVMFSVRKLAGFTAGQADTIRKGMGKKKKEIIDEYGQYFLHGSKEKAIKGCVANGIPEETAKTIWNKMAKFGEYAFNKSHATCYAAIGERTAWLSYYYPVEFMVGMLNSYLGTTDKISKYVKTCAERKLKILNPDINKSDIGFSVEIASSGRKKIRFGFAGLKGVGIAAAQAIVEEREKNGEFKSLKDFLDRMAEKEKTVGINTIEALMSTGAFDIFGMTRSSLVSGTKIIKEYLKRKKELIKAEDSLRLNDFPELFGETSISFNIPVLPEYTAKEICSIEEEYIGFFLTHPIKNYRYQLKKYTEKGLLKSIGSIDDKFEQGWIKSGSKIFIAGLVRDKKVHSYKDKKTGKNKKLLSFTLNDGTGTIRCVFFGNNAIKYDFLLANDLIVYLTGAVKSDDFGISCTAQTVEILSKD